MEDEKELNSAGDMLAFIRGELESSPQLASPNSRRGYLAAIRDFELWRGGQAVTRKLVESYRAHLESQAQATRTVNYKLKAVRWWARRLADLAAQDPSLSPERRTDVAIEAERAARVGDVKQESAKPGRSVSADEVRALLQACMTDSSPAGIRDAAMIAVAFATGMRRAELCALQWEDVASIEDGYTLALRATRGQMRQVTVYNGAGDYLRDWLALRGERPRALFLAIRKGGTILEHGLGTQSVQEMLERRAAEAGITDVHWEDIRRALAASIEEMRLKAVRGLHVPYLRGR
jgi:integrase